MNSNGKDVSDSPAGMTDSLAVRLVPQVGPPVEAYVQPLSGEDERAFERKLDAVEPAQAAAAARMHTLFAG